jgi:hypothetical protein
MDDTAYQGIGNVAEVNGADELLGLHLDQEAPQRLGLALAPQVPQRIDDGTGR